jgi:hypothetical protein
MKKVKYDAINGINQKVAIAYELDQTIKEMTKKLDSLKSEIKEYAKTNKKRVIGFEDLGAALVSDKKETTIDPLVLFNKLGKKSLELMKVQITLVKDKFGEPFAEEIGTTKNNPYSVVKLFKK